MNNITKKITSLGVLMTMLVTASGCSNSKDTKTNIIGYNVESSTDKRQDGLYSHIINTNGLVSSKYNFSSLNNINFVKVTEVEEYGTNIKNEKTTAFFRENIHLVLPDCFGSYTSPAWFNNTSNFDMQIRCEKLEDGGFGNPYIVVYSSITAKRDLYTGQTIFKDGQDIIHKGDNLSSVAIYYDGELVAFKQTGVGSECENVKQATIGNVDLALTTVKLDETKTVTYNELNKMENSLNEEENIKTLKLN